MPAATREYRDRLFTFIFGSEEHRDWTLSLYNAVNGTSYSDPEDITITTIREVLYLGMHNDVSFLLADEMSLYEQQSTYNPNMPLRMLQYAGRIYERYIKEHRKNKFGKTLIHLPTPKLVVFYNGSVPVEPNTVLYLSDSFSDDAQPDIEVRVHMINLNGQDGQQSIQACQPLREYVWTVKRIRYNMSDMDALQAVDEVIRNMPEDFVIKPYLLAHKAEVRDMLLTEYNEAEAMELFREEGRQEGREEGRQEARLTNLRNLMANLECTAEHAMDLLRIPQEDRGALLEQLS